MIVDSEFKPTAKYKCNSCNVMWLSNTTISNNWLARLFGIIPKITKCKNCGSDNVTVTRMDNMN